MRAAPALAAALALALSAFPALSQQVARAPLGPLWYEGPGSLPPGQSRVRLVFDATRAAALTPEQYWTYSRLFKRELAALSMRMPVSVALPRARAAALTGTAARYATLRVASIALSPVDGGRLVPHF